MGKIKPEKALLWTPEKLFGELGDAADGKVRSFFKEPLRTRIFKNAYQANGNRRFDDAPVADQLKLLFNGLEMLAGQGRLKYLFEVPAFPPELVLDCNAPLMYVNCTRLAKVFIRLAEELGIEGLQPAKICQMDDANKRFVTKPVGVVHPHIRGRFSCIDPNTTPNVRSGGFFNRFAFVNHDIVRSTDPTTYPYYDPTLRAVYAATKTDAVDFWMTRVNDNLFQLDGAKGINGLGTNCTVNHFRHNPPLPDDVRLVRIPGAEPRYDLEIAV